MNENNAVQIDATKDLHRRRVRLSTQTIDYLIEQAERAPKLEALLKAAESNAQYQHDRKHINADRITVLEGRNKRLNDSLYKLDSLIGELAGDMNKECRYRLRIEIRDAISNQYLGEYSHD